MPLINFQFGTRLFHIGRLCGGRYRKGSWLRRIPKGYASDRLGVVLWWE
jgi:hypothetical protein